MGWMFLSGSAVTAIVIPQMVLYGNALVAGSLFESTTRMWLCDRRSHEMHRIRDTINQLRSAAEISQCSSRLAYCIGMIS